MNNADSAVIAHNANNGTREEIAMPRTALAAFPAL